MFLVPITVTPLIALLIMTITVSTRAVTLQSRSTVEVATGLEASAVSGVLAGFARLSRSVATRPELAGELRPPGGGPPSVEAIQSHLDKVLQNDPQLVFASVFDPAGRIVATSPKANSPRGADFSYRDWYSGVRRTGTSYVSTALLSVVGDLAIAVATPIRGPAGDAAPGPVIGYVNLGYRIDAIRSEVRRLAAGQRLSLTVTDQAGVVVAAPGGPARLLPAADDPRVRRALAGRSGTMSVTGPRGRELSGYAPVGNTGWTVHADLPERVALARVRSLRSAALMMGAVLGGALMLALILLTRALHQRAVSQEAERQSAANARNLLETSLDPMVTVAPDGKISDANQATVRATGVPRERLVGSAFVDCFTDPGRAHTAYRRAFEQGRIVDYPLELRHTSGTVTEVLYNANVYRREDGTVAGVFAAARDVTQRNRAERTIREQADRLAVMVATTPDGFCRHAAEGGRLLQVNDGYCQMSGYSREELLTLGMQDLEAREAPEEYWAHSKTISQTGFDRFETQHRRKDGTVYDVEISSSYHCGSEFLVFIRDITDRKRAEQAAGRLAAIVEASDDAIIVESPSGEILTWNPGAEHLYGYRASEVVGRPVNLIVPPERQSETAADLRRAARGERVSRAETVRRTKEGTLVDVSLSLSPLCNADGRITAVSSIARDITAWKNSQAELRALNTELEERVRERATDLQRAIEDLRSFTYSVSHDLRAPLQSLSGFTGLLLEECGDRLDDTGRGYTMRIQGAAERMGRLIDDLLQLAQVGRADIRPEPVDLSAEAHSVIEELRRGDAGRDVRVVIEPGVRAVADRRLLRTAIENLLGNAWKFTSGRETATIEFGTVPTDEAELCCYVRDNGAGFDPAHADHLFEPFQRLHTAKEYPGTGVGLASVRRVVERHHGRAWAHGAVGQGATFYFTLGTAVGTALGTEEKDVSADRHHAPGHEARLPLTVLAAKDPQGVH